MKLREIAENMMAAKLRDALASNGIFNRPQAVTSQPYDASTGVDGNNVSGQNAGMSPTPAGVPKKLRQRAFFGLEKRPNTIRL